MQDKQLQDLEIILSRFTVKHAFYLGQMKKVYFDRITALHHYAASGFLQQEYPFGACFTKSAWPLTAKMFDLIVLDNGLLNLTDIKSVLTEAIRVLSDDGCLVIVQYKKMGFTSIPFRFVNKTIKSQGLHKVESHFYDQCKLKESHSWLPCLLPESFSYEYIASFSKQVIPLSPLFSGASERVKLPGKYAIGMNKAFKVNIKNK